MLIDYNNKTIYSLGLMSGTSLDGIDVAYVEHKTINGNTAHKLMHFKCYEYSQSLKQRILKNTNPATSRIDEICSLNKEIGIAYKESIELFLNDFSIDISKISFIACHGQTIYHIPSDINSLNKSTLQLGDMSEVVEKFKTIVVYDFRSRDTSAKGSGAPLVPMANFELFKNNAPIMLINIGGISNITYIPNENIDDLIACDTGPGNMIIDQLMRKLFNKEFDESGNVASNGTINVKLLEMLLDDDYYTKPFPKSTGREKYNEEYILKIIDFIEKENISKQDSLRTVTYLTSITLDIFVCKYIKNKDYKLIVSGGGSHNLTILNDLKQLGYNVETIDDADGLEALSFSILGFLRLTNRVGNVKQITGALNYTKLGSIILP